MSDTAGTDASGSPELSVLPSAEKSRVYHFNFTGDGGEFFRIWIVNVLLTIVTLGIYSAWAKVRTNRYVYGNTAVAGGYFDYHAKPLVILRGRIIALLMLGVFTAVQNFYPVFAPILLVLIFLAIPWIAIRALAFAARNSSWRNLRFNFIGRPPQAFGAYVGWNLVGVLTLGLAIPYAWYKTAKFGVDNHRLGLTQFRLTATAGNFYGILFGLFLASLAAIVLFVAVTLAYMSLFGGDPGGADSDGQIIGIILYLLMYVIFYNLYSALRFQTIYTDLRLGDSRINTRMRLSVFIWIAFTNALAMLVTLGFYYPWAKVRMTRYLVDSMELQATDVDGFVAATEEEESALGEEFGEAFDLGIGV